MALFDVNDPLDGLKLKDDMANSLNNILVGIDPNGESAFNPSSNGNIFDFSSIYGNIPQLTVTPQSDAVESPAPNDIFDEAPDYSGFADEPLVDTGEDLYVDPKYKLSKRRLQNNTPAENEAYLRQRNARPEELTRFAKVLAQANALGYGVSLPSAAYQLGQSITYKGDNKSANLLRGIGSAGKLFTGIARNVVSGAAGQKRSQDVLEEFFRKLYEGTAGDYSTTNIEQPYTTFRDGGIVEPTGKEQTGNYLFDTNEFKFNVEVEGGEYIKTPDGSIKKVVGEKHEKGGVKANLDTGTKVISDSLMLDTLSKSLADELGLKLTPKDTYATVMDKISDKLGITAVLEEQEKTFDKLNANKDVKHETTKKVNELFLGEKANQLELAKQVMEKKRKPVFEKVFAEQEKAKGVPTEPVDVLPEFKHGGTVNDKFKALCAKYGMTVEEGMAMLKKGGKVTYDNGGKFPFANTNPTNPSIDGTQHKDESGFYGGVEASKSMDWYVQNMPELAAQFFVKTDSGYQLKDGVSVRDFQKAYNTYLEDTRRYYENYANNTFVNDEERNAFLTQLDEYVQSQSFVDDKSYRAFDDLFGQYTGTRSGFTQNLVTKEQLDQLMTQGIDTFSELTDPKNSEFVAGVIGQDKLDEFTAQKSQFGTVDFRIGQFEGDGSSDGTDADNKYDPEHDTKFDYKARAREVGFPLLPDQSLLPPSGLQPHLRGEVKFDRIDPARISNEPFLRANAETLDFLEQSFDSSPTSQRMAFLSNAAANSQDSVNEQLFKNEVANVQSKMQADTFNAQTQAREELTNLQQDLDFERRQLTALANTDADINSFFEANRRIGVGEFNTINKYRVLNQMFDNFQLTPTGDIQLFDDGSGYLDLNKIGG